MEVPVGAHTATALNEPNGIIHDELSMRAGVFNIPR